MFEDSKYIIFKDYKCCSFKLCSAENHFKISLNKNKAENKKYLINSNSAY